MGFDISKEKLVTINDSHDEYADTDEKQGINRKKIKSIVIYFAFKRFKNTSKVADNCPFIYALKKHENFRTNLYNIKKINKKLEYIISVLKDNTYDYDFIILIPSKHNINLMLMNRLKKYYKNSKYLDDFFVKKNLLEIKNDLENLKNKSITRKLKFDIKQQIKQYGENGLLNLKSIGMNKRRFLEPIKVKNKNQSINYQCNKILIVEDIVSTGTTIKQAKNILNFYFPNSEIECFSLFGPINRNK